MLDGGGVVAELCLCAEVGHIGPIGSRLFGYITECFIDPIFVPVPFFLRSADKYAVLGAKFLMDKVVVGPFGIVDCPYLVRNRDWFELVSGIGAVGIGYLLRVGDLLQILTVLIRDGGGENAAALYCGHRVVPVQPLGKVIGVQAVQVCCRRVVRTVFRVGFSSGVVIPAKGDLYRAVLVEIGDDAVFSASDGDDVAEHPVRVPLIDEYRYEQAVLVFTDIQDIVYGGLAFCADGERPAADGFPDGGLDFAQQGIRPRPCRFAVDEAATTGEQRSNCSGIRGAECG